MKGDSDRDSIDFVQPARNGLWLMSALRCRISCSKVGSS